MPRKDFKLEVCYETQSRRFRVLRSNRSYSITWNGIRTITVIGKNKTSALLATIIANALENGIPVDKKHGVIQDTPTG